jgi:hypothetical protein
MFARSASEKDRPEDDGRGGGGFTTVFPVLVIIAVMDFVTLLLFFFKVGALFLSSFSVCIIFAFCENYQIRFRL